MIIILISVVLQRIIRNTSSQFFGKNSKSRSYHQRLTIMDKKARLCRHCYKRTAAQGGCSGGMSEILNVRGKHKPSPFCCSVTVEVFFIPTFFSSASSLITSLLLPIEVTFPMKFVCFCQRTQRRQSTHTTDVNDSPRKLISRMLIYSPILRALTIPKGNGICCEQIKSILQTASCELPWWLSSLGYW